MLIWQIPLSIASFVFYRLIRVMLKALIAVHQRLTRNKPPAWRALVGDVIGKPLILPTIIATAPRWNPHAITASLGPFTVQQSITIDVEAARRSAEVWTVVINDFPGMQTVTSLGSLEPPGQRDDGVVHLEPGQYMLALRYYRCTEPVELPAVQVDDRPGCTALVLPTGANRYFEALRQRESWFYRALQYYVFVMLRLRDRLPERFVWHEYLPQPNPETRFSFGHFHRGQTLTLELGTDTLEARDVYLTCYDRASFPLVWYPIREQRHTTGPMPEDGFYLLRIVQNQPARAGWQARVDVQVG